MGYTPGCWKHGSRPDIPARPGSRSPNGLRLAVAYALDGLDGQNPALWAVWTASRVHPCGLPVACPPFHDNQRRVGGREGGLRASVQ
jgi:hypothetical protein